MEDADGPPALPPPYHRVLHPANRPRGRDHFISCRHLKATKVSVFFFKSAAAVNYLAIIRRLKWRHFSGLKFTRRPLSSVGA